MQDQNTAIFGDKLKYYLLNEGRTQRWLLKKLQEKDFFIAQTQLSNRINGFVPFKEIEKSIINEVLGTDF